VKKAVQKTVVGGAKNGSSGLEKKALPPKTDISRQFFKQYIFIFKNISNKIKKKNSFFFTYQFC